MCKNILMKTKKNKIKKLREEREKNSNREALNLYSKPRPYNALLLKEFFYLFILCVRYGV
jgi:hypothetical protein